MEEPPSMAIKMGEASNTNSEENDGSSSNEKTKVSKVWISRQLVNHWFLNTVSLIFVRFECLLFITCNNDIDLYLCEYIPICILAIDVPV